MSAKISSGIKKSCGCILFLLGIIVFISCFTTAKGLVVSLIPTILFFVFGTLLIRSGIKKN